MHRTLDELLDGADGYEGAANAARDAAAFVLAHFATELGLTGFQASWAALQAYWKAMGYRGGGLVLTDQDLRYPQYDHHRRLEEHLADQRLVCWLGDEAEHLLQRDLTFAASAVVEHWRQLVAKRDALPVEVGVDART